MSSTTPLCLGRLLLVQIPSQIHSLPPHLPPTPPKACSHRPLTSERPNPAPRGSPKPPPSPPPGQGVPGRGRELTPQFSRGLRRGAKEGESGAITLSRPRTAATWTLTLRSLAARGRGQGEERRSALRLRLAVRERSGQERRPRAGACGSQVLSRRRRGLPRDPSPPSHRPRLPKTLLRAANATLWAPAGPNQMVTGGDG